MKILSRSLFFLVALGMTFDVCPPALFRGAIAKQAWSKGLSFVGLWQGQWKMFSPDPVLNNAVYVAEFQTADGSAAEWTSPNWREVGNLSKFVSFREMNFYNRLYIYRNSPAWKDFVDWLRVNQAPASTRNIRLTRQQFQMAPLVDGELPSREETTWILSSDYLLDRSYEP